jgi:hypothetical protein
MPRPTAPALAALLAFSLPAFAQEAPELRGRLSASVADQQATGGGSASTAGRSLRQRTIRIITIHRNPEDTPSSVLLSEIQSGR